MKNILKQYKGIILLLVVEIILSGCGGKSAATPTTDPNMLFTQVAETVMVSITQTAAAIPTETPPPPPTATPTEIPLPTEDIYALPTETPGIPGYPTATVQYYGDAAKWTAQSPVDGVVLKKSSIFTFHGCMHNIGSTSWDTTYRLSYAAGPNMWGSQSSWNVGTIIDPGKKWCFDIPQRAPGSAGDYTTRWYFKTGKGVFIYEVYFHFFVS